MIILSPLPSLPFSKKADIMEAYRKNKGEHLYAFFFRLYIQKAFQNCLITGD